MFNIYAGLTWKHITKDFEFKKVKPSAKLNEKDLHKICNIFTYSPKMNNVEIGKIFDVNRKTISDIRNRKTWNHITKQYTF